MSKNQPLARKKIATVYIAKKLQVTSLMMFRSGNLFRELLWSSKCDKKDFNVVDSGKIWGKLHRLRCSRNIGKLSFYWVFYASWEFIRNIFVTVICLDLINAPKMHTSLEVFFCFCDKLQQVIWQWNMKIYQKLHSNLKVSEFQRYFPAIFGIFFA